MSIFFPGDRVSFTRDGEPVEGVIEDFTYDVPALYRGEPGDTALVRTDAGDLVPVFITGIEAA